MHTEVHINFLNKSTSRQPNLTLYFTLGYKLKTNLLSYGSSIIKTAADTKVNERIVQPKPTIPRIKHSSINVIADKPVADKPYKQPSQPATPRFSNKESQFYTFQRTRSRFENQPQDTSYLAYPPPTTRKEENQV